jgi:hypothetical protein
MKKTRLSFIALILVLLLPPSLSACDSGGDTGNELSDATLNSFSTMLGNVFSALSLAVSQVGKTDLPAARSAAILSPDDTVPCPQGGQLDVTGDFGSGPELTFDLDVTFEGCNGIDGTLAVTGSGSIAQNQSTFDLLLNGSVSDDCTIEFNDFSERVTANTLDRTATLTLDGTIGATCDGQSFTCTMNDMQIDENTTGDDFKDVCAPVR